MATSIPSTPGRRIDAMLVFFAGQLLAGLLAVICLHLVNRAPVVITNFRYDLSLYFWLGIPFSQVTVLATWNALGDGRHFLRPLGSVFCLIVIWLVGFCLPAWLGSFREQTMIPGIAMFVQWIVVQIPLWIVRLNFGWQMGMIDHRNTASDRSPVQFGIKHLILWTTCVAIVLGISRIVLRREFFESQDVAGFGLFLLCNSLFAWPTLLGSLANRWLPIALLASFGFTMAVAFAEPFVFHAALKSGGSRANMFWWLDSIQFAWIAGSMLILRWFGFRLVRTG